MTPNKLISHLRYYLFATRINKPFLEGEKAPLFYLPVWKSYDKYTLELWILPLAPIVWLIYVVRDVLWIIWRDMTELQRNIMEYSRARGNHDTK